MTTVPVAILNEISCAFGCGPIRLRSFTSLFAKGSNYFECAPTRSLVSRNIALFSVFRPNRFRQIAMSVACAPTRPSLSVKFQSLSGLYFGSIRWSFTFTNFLERGQSRSLYYAIFQRLPSECSISHAHCMASLKFNLFRVSADPIPLIINFMLRRVCTDPIRSVQKVDVFFCFLFFFFFLQSVHRPDRHFARKLKVFRASTDPIDNIARSFRVNRMYSDPNALSGEIYKVSRPCTEPSRGQFYAKITRGPRLTRIA